MNFTIFKFRILIFGRRYQDKSSAKHNLDDFLTNAYTKQIRELNGTTGRRKPSRSFLCAP